MITRKYMQSYISSMYVNYNAGVNASHATRDFILCERAEMREASFMWL